MMRLLVFACVSLVFAWISRRSLAQPRSHGFPRFFAWECLAALVVVNFRGLAEWFRDPLGPRQLASWFLLFVSVVPVVWGTVLLQRHVQPTGTPDGRDLFAFERTTKLVTSGVYEYIRHPLYSSLLLLTWGVFLKRPGWAAAGLAVCASAMLFMTARAEETENRQYFGADYDLYMEKSKRFIPFVF